jgi:hypothetical protein
VERKRADRRRKTTRKGVIKMGSQDQHRHLESSLQKIKTLDGIDDVFAPCESCGTEWIKCMETECCCVDCAHEIDDGDDDDDVE